MDKNSQKMNMEKNFQKLCEENFFEHCYNALANYLEDLEADAGYLRLEDELESNQAKIEEVRKLLGCLNTVMWE